MALITKSSLADTLSSAADKVTNIQSDVTNMIIIDGSINTTRDMNDKLHDVRNEISSAGRSVESNMETIESLCSDLGISISAYSSSGGSSGSGHMGGMSGVRSTVTYTRY